MTKERKYKPENEKMKEFGRRGRMKTER